MRWDAHIRNINASVDIDAISETVDSVVNVLTAEFLNKQSPEFFDGGPATSVERFEDIDLSRFVADEVSAEHLCAALRVTSMGRDQITGWDHALIVARAACIREGKDPEDVLSGLVTATDLLCEVRDEL